MVFASDHRAASLFADRCADIHSVGRSQMQDSNCGELYPFICARLPGDTEPPTTQAPSRSPSAPTQSQTLDPSSRQPGWYASRATFTDSDGTHGLSCDASCAEVGLICTEEQLRAHNGEVLTSEQVIRLVRTLYPGSGFDPNGCNGNELAQADVPNFGGMSSTECHVSGANRPASSYHCNSAAPHQRYRLCWCHGASITPAPTIPPTSQPPTAAPSASPSTPPPSTSGPTTPPPSTLSPTTPPPSSLGPTSSPAITPSETTLPTTALPAAPAVPTPVAPAVPPVPASSSPAAVPSATALPPAPSENGNSDGGGGGDANNNGNDDDDAAAAGSALNTDSDDSDDGLSTLALAFAIASPVTVCLVVAVVVVMYRQQRDESGLKDVAPSALRSVGTHANPVYQLSFEGNTPHAAAAPGVDYEEIDDGIGGGGGGGGVTPIRRIPGSQGSDEAGSSLASAYSQFAPADQRSGNSPSGSVGQYGALTPTRRSTATRPAPSSTAYALLGGGGGGGGSEADIVRNTSYISADDAREPWLAWVAAPAASAQAAQVALREARLGDGSYCFRKGSGGLVLCVLHKGGDVAHLRFKRHPQSGGAVEMLDLPDITGRQFGSMAEYLLFQTRNVLDAGLPIPLSRCIPHCGAGVAGSVSAPAPAASGSVVYDANQIEYGGQVGCGPTPAYAVVNSSGQRSGRPQQLRAAAARVAGSSES